MLVNWDIHECRSQRRVLILGKTPECQRQQFIRTRDGKHAYAQYNVYIHAFRIRQIENCAKECGEVDAESQSTVLSSRNSMLGAYM